MSRATGTGDGDGRVPDEGGTSRRERRAADAARRDAAYAEAARLREEGASALATGAIGRETTAGREEDRLADLRRRLRQTGGRGRKLRGLIILLRPYRVRVALMFGALLLATAAALAPVPLAKRAIDDGIAKGDEGALNVIVLAFLASALLYWLATYLQTYLTGWVGQRALQDLRVQLFRHLQTLSLGFYSRTRAGVVISRITNDVQALDSLVSDGITTLFQSSLMLLGVVITLLIFNVELALLTFLVIPLLALGALAFRIASADAFRRTRERIAAITGYLQETLSGIRVVRSFAQERRHVARFADLNQANRDANMTTVYLNAAYFPGVELLSAMVTVGILVIGGIEVDQRRHLDRRRVRLHRRAEPVLRPDPAALPALHDLPVGDGGARQDLRAARRGARAGRPSGCRGAARAARRAVLRGGFVPVRV